MSQALAKLNDEDQMALAPVQVQRQNGMYPVPNELQSMVFIARNLPQAAGSAVPKGTTEGRAFAQMLAGWELGIGPMASIRHMVVINGRTEPDTQLMMGICLANDPTVDFRWNEVSGTRAELELWRGGVMKIRTSYTPEDAERAGQAKRPTRTIWKDNRPVGEEEFDGPWQTHTHLMLAYNAARTAMKLAAPDLINSIASTMSRLVEAEAMMGNVAEAEYTVIGGLGGQPELQGNAPKEKAKGWQAREKPSSGHDYAQLMRDLTGLLTAHNIGKPEVAAFLGRDATPKALGDWLDENPGRTLLDLVTLSVTDPASGEIVEGSFEEAQP